MHGVVAVPRLWHADENVQMTWIVRPHTLLMNVDIWAKTRYYLVVGSRAASHSFLGPCCPMLAGQRGKWDRSRRTLISGRICTIQFNFQKYVLAGHHSVFVRIWRTVACLADVWSAVDAPASMPSHRSADIRRSACGKHRAPPKKGDSTMVGFSQICRVCLSKLACLCLRADDYLLSKK